MTIILLQEKKKWLKFKDVETWVLPIIATSQGTHFVDETRRHCPFGHSFLILDEHFLMKEKVIDIISRRINHENVWLQEFSQLTCPKLLKEILHFFCFHTFCHCII
jgi:hypothetical protein